MNYTEILQPLSWNLPTILCVATLAISFLSFILMVLAPNRLRVQASWLSSFLILCAAFISVYLLQLTWAGSVYHTRFTWFTIAGWTDFTAGILLDINTALMLVVVNVISFVVHIYSTVYMADDPGYKRYFAFLGLFTGSMLGIIMADNLLLIFIFWELVGLSSYLLISHWYQKKEASAAATKAFIVNRIGDAGFLVGLSILWLQFKTLDLEALSQLMAASELSEGQWVFGETMISKTWLTVAGIGLFMGAVGKSAQFPLQIWLPDAMEGPTPVSALIHAATMVAAGVFLMARVFVLLDVDALTIIAVIGAITALMGAVAALAQHDIKKVLAYSTISQLGYMLMGIGVGAYDAALFHLFTHAFFKACLFLAAGSVIYALHEYGHHTNKEFDAQDMRNMGGLRKYLPVTFAAYTAAGLALIGIPFFSGYLSKEALLSGAYAWADMMSGESLHWYYLVPDLGFLTVVLTAIYMFRQLLLVFFGKFRMGGGSAAVKEGPWVMRFSLMLLSLMSLGLVWSVNPFDMSHSWFLQALKVPEIITPEFDNRWQPGLLQLSMTNHLQVTIISMVMILIGGMLAWYLYKPGSRYEHGYATRPDALNKLQFFALRNWYLDELYQNIIVKPLKRLSFGLGTFERSVIDRIIDGAGVFSVIIAHVVGWWDKMVVDGFVNISVFFAGRVGVLTRSLQGGRIQSYILISLLGVLLMIFWIIW